MVQHEVRPAVYPIFSAGVDWITASGCPGSSSLAMEKFWDELESNERAAGRDVKPAARLGYKGWQAQGAFFGRSTQGVLCQLTTLRAALGAKELTTLATKVSRLDVQVTVFCGRDGPNLAQEGFNALDQKRRSKGRMHAYSYTLTRPAGATLSINQRISDLYGRLYDKGAEAKLGPPHFLWRYELEMKRKPAHRWAHILAGSERPAALSCELVHEFYSSKKVLPRFQRLSDDLAGQRFIEERTTDVRRWLDTSVSVTIAKQIKKVGLEVTLRDLHLHHLFDLRKDKSNA